jgi:PAS domain S-box-containing protein
MVMLTPQPDVTATGADTTLEDHLRRIIETQPVCLTRLAADGTFLAVNDAALQMLGASRPDQVLATSVLDRVEFDHQAAMADFLARMAVGERGSMEVGLTALDGVTRAIQLQAVGMTAPVDGLASVLCSVRDVSEMHRLEHAVVEGALREANLASALEAAKEELAVTQAGVQAREQAQAADAERVLELEDRLALALADHAEQQAALDAALTFARAERDDALARAAAAEERARGEDAGRQALTDASDEQRRELEHLRDVVAALESAASDVASREREALDRYHADEVRWTQALAELDATRQRELAGLGEQVATLDVAVREACARERDAVALYEAEKTRWQASLDEALAAHQRQADELRAQVAALGAAVTDAAARERDAIALYETEKMHWQGLAERAAAHEHECAVLGTERTRLTAALDDATTRAREALAHHEMEIAALRTAVSDAEYGLAAARAELRALDAQWQHASRLADTARVSASLASDMEAALAMTTAGTRRLLAVLPDGEPRHLAEQALSGSLEATLLARQLRRRGVPTPPLAIAPVVQRLEPVLAAMATPGAEFAILTGAPAAGVAIRQDDLEQVLMLLVTAARAAIASASHVSLEIAEVTVDPTVAGERAVRPGPYALLALHAGGIAAGETLPDALFKPMVAAETWAQAGLCFGALQRLVTTAGGHLWASREGSSGYALELYLPQVTDGSDAQPSGEACA